MDSRRTHTPEEIAARFPHATCRPSRLSMLLTDPAVTRTLHVGLFVANMMIGAFLIQLGSGNVPIPEGWQWAVPILLAGLNAVTVFLPRAGSERLAGQVNQLQSAGVPKSRMVVLSDDEAALRLTTNRGGRAWPPSA